MTSLMRIMGDWKGFVWGLLGELPYHTPAHLRHKLQRCVNLKTFEKIVQLSYSQCK